VKILGADNISNIVVVMTLAELKSITGGKIYTHGIAKRKAMDGDDIPIGTSS